MKKLLCAALVISAGLDAWAQEIVKFMNGPTTLISSGGWGRPTAPVPTNEPFYFALLWAPPIDRATVTNENGYLIFTDPDPRLTGRFYRLRFDH